MEDLQDVLEDVTYMNAMSDDSPKPTKPWEFPEDQPLKEFIAKELEADPQLFSLDKICENSLGFYMFCKYCKASGDDAKARFLEEVVRYKRIMGDKGKASLATQLVKKYLVQQNKSLEPQKPDINESDLRRVPALVMSPQEFLPLYEEAQAQGAVMSNALRLGGPVRDEICDFVQREAEPLIQDLFETNQSASPMARGGKRDSNVRSSRRGDESASGEAAPKKNGEPITSDKAQGAVDSSEQTANGDLAGATGGPATATVAPLSPPSKNSVFAGMIASNDNDSAGENEKPGHSSPGDVTNDSHTVTVEEESFFQRKQQKFPFTLFDKLELMVWEALKTNHYDSFLGSPLFKQYQSFVFLSKKPVSEEDFTLFRVLGRGGFGQVNGCKRCQTGKLYAMKVMNKRRVKAHQSEKLCWNERKILSLVDSPFVVCLKYAFTSKEDLFLILDLMRGGDLAFHLDKRGRFTMEEARYFAARTLLGLQHLHKNGIVYRDLKPDNILMDERGKTRISDLGLACKVTPDLVGTYGTRGYWAPEMIMKDSKGHRIRYNQCVDWFSFGCVVYEMIVGFSPFRSEKIYEWSGLTKKDKHKVIDMAVIGMDPDFDRRYFDDDSIDLCKKLLEKDPRKRLGARGSADVMAHPWFIRGGVEWDVMIADAAEPPFVPNQDINAASQSAIGSFNDENQYRKMKIEESDHEIYQGWNWASQSTFFGEVVQFLKAEEVQGPIVPQQSNEGCCTLL